MNKFKLSLRVSTIGLLACLIYSSICQIPAIREWIWGYSFLREMWGRLWMFTELLCVIIACVSIFCYRNEMPMSDGQLRILTHIATWSTLAAVAMSIFLHPNYFLGEHLYINMRYWQEVMIVFPAICWLWKLSSMTLGEDSLSNFMSILVLLGALLPAVVLLMMLTSSVCVFITGHVVGFGTYFYFSWIRFIVPAVLFPCYAIHIKR